MSNELSKNIPLKNYLASDAIKNALKERLGARAGSFISALVQVQRGNAQLQACSNESIMGAALMSASLDLAFDPNLGEAYIVPYGQQASFQIGYKGLIALAQRTGLYKRLGWKIVYEGELVGWDELEGDLRIDASRKKSDTIVGYAAKFTLLNGFERGIFWTKEACHVHGKRYSKSYSRPASPWQQQPDSMCLKTVLRDLLGHWGPKSIEMRDGLVRDRMVFKDENPDNAVHEDALDVTSTVESQPEPDKTLPPPKSPAKKKETAAAPAPEPAKESPPANVVPLAPPPEPEDNPPFDEPESVAAPEPVPASAPAPVPTPAPAPPKPAAPTPDLGVDPAFSLNPNDIHGSFTVWLEKNEILPAAVMNYLVGVRMIGDDMEYKDLPHAKIIAVWKTREKVLPKFRAITAELMLNA